MLGSDSGPNPNYLAQSLHWLPTSRDTETGTIRFPTDNLLNADGLARIRARTIARSQRHEVELSGVLVLIGRVRELISSVRSPTAPKAARRYRTRPSS